MASEHQEAPQEQSIPCPRDPPLPVLNHRTHNYTDRTRRRNPSYSRSRSRNRQRSRHRYRKDRHQSRNEEKDHNDSPDDPSEDQHVQHRRGRNRKRRSRSVSQRPRSPAWLVRHRGDDRRRGRQRSRSISTSESSPSSLSRRAARRSRRRKLSRHHQTRRSSPRRHRHRRRQGSDGNPPRHAPMANNTAARAGIVSDEDGDPARQNQHKLGHHAVTSPLASAKDSGRNAGGGAGKSKTSKYSTKKRSSQSSSYDDTIGHFQGSEGSIIADRYRVEREVGMGTFGRVVECLDLNRRSSRRVAVKIVRNVKRYYESAMIEADIVKDVNRRGGRGVTHCAVMYDTFTFSGHYCMVFEKLGPSLYDFQKRQNHRPFPLTCVRDFAKQLLETLEFLHSFRLIHTDLKPENVLLVSSREVYHNRYCIPESTHIKVIDFGAATYDNEKKSSVVNTRQYRAPEVILGVGWSMPSDLWSLGCILVELFQGELLFATHDDIEHLALIEQVVGAFPRRMLKRGKNTEIISEAFGGTGAHRMERVLSPESFSYVKRVGSMESLISGAGEGWFLRLLRGILVTDPNERATARESLRTLPS